MTGYELSRYWFDWAFNNPEKVKPIHAAIFFFAIEHKNRLGGKEKFGFPSLMTMEAIGVKKHQTYSKALNELAEWGFIDFIERSKNQFSSNIISIRAVPKNGKARGKALDKAFIKHGSKQGHSTGQSMDNIVKPINQLTNNNPDEDAAMEIEVVLGESEEFKINQIYDRFVQEIKSGERYTAIEAIYRRLKVKKGTLQKILEDYKGQLVIDNKLHKNTQAMLTHFNNYCNVQDRMGKLDEYKTAKRAGAL